MTESNGPITKQPTTKRTPKPQKIAYPRFMNAIETFMDHASLTNEQSIGELMEALKDAFMKEARS